MMKQRIASLVERTRDDGTKYLIGNLGDAAIMCEQIGSTRSGSPAWSLYLLPPKPKTADRPQQEHNRRSAADRVARRKAEQVEHQQ